MIRYPACGTPPHRRVPAFCDIANIGRDDITPPHSVGPVDTWILAQGIHGANTLYYFPFRDVLHYLHSTQLNSLAWLKGAGRRLLVFGW